MLALTLCAQAQPLDRVQRLLAFRRFERAAAVLRTVRQHDFDWLLLKDQLEPNQGWLEKAQARTPSERLRLALRRYRSDPEKWTAVEQQWKRQPLPELACEYFLARADFFSAQRDEHARSRICRRRVRRLGVSCKKLRWIGRFFSMI